MRRGGALGIVGASYSKVCTVCLPEFQSLMVMYRFIWGTMAKVICQTLGSHTEAAPKDTPFLQFLEAPSFSDIVEVN